MSATDELLRLLDGFEREYNYNLPRVKASETRAEDEAVREAYERIREESARAIAATLGSDKKGCENLLWELVGALDVADATDASKKPIVTEYARRIAATLGSETNPDGLPVGLTISEDGSLLNWRGENYVRQSTLGGKLTAEQVSKAVYAHSIHADCADADWQAIADELNAALGGGECEDEGGVGANGEQVFSCSECGCVLSLYDSDGMNTLCTRFVYDYPRFCPSCGKAVKR